MTFSKTVSFISKEGNEYSIIFSEYSRELLPPLKMDLPIIDIIIDTEDHLKINGFGTLLKISNTIKNYLQENDVIIYSYCDNKEIKRSKNKEHLVPQHYRSMLFESLFKKNSDPMYVSRAVVINDEGYGNHYIHLFSRIANENVVEILSDELIKFNK